MDTDLLNFLDRVKRIQSSSLSQGYEIFTQPPLYPVLLPTSPNELNAIKGNFPVISSVQTPSIVVGSPIYSPARFPSPLAATGRSISPQSSVARSAEHRFARKMSRRVLDEAERAGNSPTPLPEAMGGRPVVTVDLRRVAPSRLSPSPSKLDAGRGFERKVFVDLPVERIDLVRPMGDRFDSMRPEARGQIPRKVRLDPEKLAQSSLVSLNRFNEGYFTR